MPRIDWRFVIRMWHGDLAGAPFMEVLIIIINDRLVRSCVITSPT